MRVKRLVQASVVLGVFVLVAACGGTSEKAGGQPAAGEALPSAEVVKHMHDHLAQVQQIQHALIRGDLDGATTAARTFAGHQELTGLPENVHGTIEDMRQAAQEVGAATTLEAASDATARMIAQCGACHSTMAAKPGIPAPPAAQEQAARPVVAKMLEHQHAVDMLYQGLVVPSNEMWKQGAEALKASPLKADAFPVDAQLSKEALDAQARTHEVAEKAAAAATPTARAEVYGDLIGGCASCHSISGRVLGPGAPK